MILTEHREVVGAARYGVEGGNRAGGHGAEPHAHVDVVEIDEDVGERQITPPVG